MAIETKPTFRKITRYKEITDSPLNYLSDQMMAAFGTTRKSEVFAYLIANGFADRGTPWELAINNFLDQYEAITDDLLLENGDWLLTETGQRIFTEQ